MSHLALFYSGGGAVGAEDDKDSCSEKRKDPKKPSLSLKIRRTYFGEIISTLDIMNRIGQYKNQQ